MALLMVCEYGGSVCACLCSHVCGFTRMYRCLFMCVRVEIGAWSLPFVLVSKVGFPD